MPGNAAKDVRIGASGEQRSPALAPAIWLGAVSLISLSPLLCRANAPAKTAY